MRHLYRPWLLLLTVTLPQMLIMMMLWRVFGIIRPDLTSNMLQSWMLATGFLSLACLSSFIYALYCSIKKKPIDPKAAIALLSVYLIFIYLIFTGYSTLIPSTIPTWTLLGMNPGWTILTLTMPVLSHSLLLISLWSIEKFNLKNGLKDLGIAILFPFGWYIFTLIISAFIHISPPGFEQILPILIVLSIVSFFFFMIRGFVLILKDRKLVGQMIIGPVCFACSLAGLGLNLTMGNIFGNFNQWPFYVLAVATGILVCIPPLKNKKMRLALYAGKAFCLSYTLYFFMVFLPYLPLSILLIIVMGGGILMLTPLVLTILHVTLLADDFHFLKAHYHKGILLAILIFGCVSLPSAYTIAVIQDKGTLDTALKYTFQRTYEETDNKNLNFSAIKRSIDNIKEQKKSQRSGTDIFLNASTPILSAFYNSVVLNNYSLSDDKIHQIETSLLGEKQAVQSNQPLELAPENIDIITQSLKTQTRYDSKESVYKTWVDLTLKNNSFGQNEYRTLFKLPEGSVITNYYLYVGNEKKYGLIADKRAANWVYQQAKNIKRDPGLLTEVGGNFIEFKIFPFEPSQVRQSGFEITHKTPITLNFDHQDLVLKVNESGTSNDSTLKPITLSSGVVFLSKAFKETLPTTTRNAQVYMLLDYSKGNEKNIQNYMKRVNTFITAQHLEKENPRIFALNHQMNQIPYHSQWAEKIITYGSYGGLNLDYALKKILYTHAIKEPKTTPVVILVTDHPENAYLSDNLKEMNFAAPEGISYAVLNPDGSLQTYDVKDTGIEQQPRTIKTFEKPIVRVWKNNDKSYFLADNGEDSILTTDYKTPIDLKSIIGTQWEKGMIIKSMHQQAQFHPETQLQNQLNMVKASITSHVMSPQTSFIVLENQVQENAMLEKQKEILAAKRPLEIGDLQQMDEPPLILLLLMVALIIGFKNRRKPFE